MGVSINGGTPIAGWFIKKNHGKSIYKWMIWGYPHFRKSPYILYIYRPSSFMANRYKKPWPYAYETLSIPSRPSTQQCATISAYITDNITYTALSNGPGCPRIRKLLLTVHFVINKCLAYLWSHWSERVVCPVVTFLCCDKQKNKSQEPQGLFEKKLVRKFWSAKPRHNTRYTTR